MISTKSQVLAQIILLEVHTLIEMFSWCIVYMGLCQINDCLKGVTQVLCNNNNFADVKIMFA